MIPLYFPYTYISRQTAAILHACFGTVSVYQPSEVEVPDAMRQLAAEGFIELRVPVKDSDHRLARILKDYRNWAVFQRPGKGIDAQYLKTLKNRLPFFDDTAPEQIRSMIKGQMANRPPAAADADTTEKRFKAQIFLQLAQEFDLQNDLVSEELVRCTQMEHELIKGLHGEEAATDPTLPAKEVFSNSETADYMMAQRLEAWATLMLADPRQSATDAAGFFITCNQTVLELIEARMPQTREVVALETTAFAGKASDQIHDSQKQLGEQLAVLLTADLSAGVGTAAEKLANLPWPTSAHSDPADRDRVKAQIYVVPDKTPLTLFTSLAAGEMPIAPIEAPAGPIRNTIVVVVAEAVK
jgi:hypothetical protein